MTESIFTISTGVDDGRCRESDGGIYDNNNTYIELGWTGATALQTWIRFDNVTIPSDATIDSCVLRCIAYQSNAITNVNLTVHLEDADDPTYPTNGADVIGRSLTTGTSWSAIPAWTAGSSYDSVDFASELQTVIDRVGWNSGQAVIVNIVDNGSSVGASRLAAAYEHSSYDSVELVVNWSVPFKPYLDEDITIEESITLESDLIRQENITLTESVTALLGFGEFLPTFTEDITITESITMERGFAEVTEAIQNINISEYSFVDISPTISVFESITLEETGNIRPEPFAYDQIDLSEYVLTRRGYWADVEDTAIFSDTFDVFHYSNWLRQNVAQAKQRFFFTLTGTTDGVDDIELPASSIYARKRSGDPTYLQITIPTFNYAVEVALRPSGEMLVDMGYEIDGEIGLRERILEADLEDISTYEGPVNRSIILTGHRTQSFGGQVTTFNRALVIYRGYQTRARSFRFAFIEPFINPGDTVVVGAESFTCNNIIYTINVDRTVMEIREAL